MKMPKPATPAGSSATRQAKILIALLFFSTLINYLDRQTLSMIAPVIRKTLSLSAIDYSHIVFAFLLGYTLSQALAGSLIDRIGTRMGMILCVAVWSVAAVLHSLAVGVVSFCVFRFLLGIAEAGNWPGSVKAVSEHFPPERSAFAVGLFNSGSSVGAIIAPPLVISIVQQWGWRSMFVVVGASGFVWILLWQKFYRAAPGQTLERPEAATSQIRFGTRAYLQSRNVWGLMIGRFFADPVWWFYAFWLPEYLVKSRGFSLANIATIVWIPFAFAAVGNWAGGHVSGFLLRRGFPAAASRKAVMVCSAILMLAGLPAVWAQTRFAVIAWISVVLFAYSSWAANVLSLPADLFTPREVGRVTGLSGTGGAIGGMSFTLLTGWLVQNSSYTPVFAVACGMIVCAAMAVTVLIRERLPVAALLDAESAGALERSP
jgi:ACS family hexuronate transporter-like MFS transporter